MLCRASDPPLSSGGIHDGVNGYWSLRLADAQDLLMLILPHVFIFAVAHELPPVIRLIFFFFFLVGIKRFTSVWPLLSCIFRKGQVFSCPLELCVPRDGVLNNLCLFLHQQPELFILFTHRRLPGSGFVQHGCRHQESVDNFRAPSGPQIKVIVTEGMAGLLGKGFTANSGKWLFLENVYTIFSKNSSMFLPKTNMCKSKSVNHKDKSQDSDSMLKMTFFFFFNVFEDLWLV